jgi:hypothetical protein
MTKKYLIITDLDEIRQVSEVERGALIAVKDGYTKWLINTEDCTYYRADKNVWLPFEKSGDIDL